MKILLLFSILVAIVAVECSEPYWSKSANIDKRGKVFAFVGNGPRGPFKGISGRKRIDVAYGALVLLNNQSKYPSISYGRYPYYKYPYNQVRYNSYTYGKPNYKYGTVYARTPYNKYGSAYRPINGYRSSYKPIKYGVAYKQYPSSYKYGTAYKQYPSSYRYGTAYKQYPSSYRYGTAYNPYNKRYGTAYKPYNRLYESNDLKYHLPEADRVFREAKLLGARYKF